MILVKYNKEKQVIYILKQIKLKQEAAGFKICAPEHAQKNETNLP